MEHPKGHAGSSVRRRALRAAGWIVGVALLVSASPGSQSVPDLLRGPYLQMPTPTSMVVRFRTAQPVAGRLWVSDTETGLVSVVDGPVTTEHALRAVGLVPGRAYEYAVGTPAGPWVGFDAAHRFETLPVPGSGAPVRLAFLGDVGTGDANQAKVRDALVAFVGDRPAHALVLLGDNAYTHGTDAQFQSGLFDPYRDVFAQVPVLAVFGNHDALSADSATQTGPYYDAFELPADGSAGGVASQTEAYYAADIGDVHLIVLDSAEPKWAPMLSWLQQDLAARTAPWTIVCFHHPPYSKGSHDSDTETRLVEMRQKVLPLLEAAGVDLVLSGHSHSMERSFLVDGHYGPSGSFGPHNVLDGGDGRVGGDGAYEKPTAPHGVHDGTVYVVAGSSGKTSGGPLDHPVHFFSANTLGALVVDVHGLQLDARFVDEKGATVDSFTIVKDHALAAPLVHRPVELGAVWRYWDQGTPPPGDWKGTAYDDSAWGSGPAPLGYGEPFIQTAVSYGSDSSNKPITTWFRASFELPFDPARVEAARLLALYDDGFVAYLNGEEIGRAGLEGSVGPADPALPHEAVVPEVVAVSIPPHLLQAGTNVLAVEVHQTNPQSSDLVWDTALEIDAFVPYLGNCASGVVDVLRVEGADGGEGRGVHVEPFTPFEVSVDASDGIGPEGFLLLATLGWPVPSEAHVVPGAGPLCGVVDLIVAESPQTPLPALTVAPPAPWSALLPGLPAGAAFTLQAVSLTPGGPATSNAVFVRVH